MSASLGASVAGTVAGLRGARDARGLATRGGAAVVAFERGLDVAEESFFMVWRCSNVRARPETFPRARPNIRSNAESRALARAPAAAVHASLKPTKMSSPAVGHDKPVELMIADPCDEHVTWA